MSVAALAISRWKPGDVVWTKKDVKIDDIGVIPKHTVFRVGWSEASRAKHASWYRPEKLQLYVMRMSKIPKGFTSAHIQLNNHTFVEYLPYRFFPVGRVFSSKNILEMPRESVVALVPKGTRCIVHSGSSLMRIPEEPVLVPQNYLLLCCGNFGTLAKYQNELRTKMTRGATEQLAVWCTKQDLYNQRAPMSIHEALELYHFSKVYQIPSLAKELMPILKSHCDYPTDPADIGLVLGAAVTYHELLPLVVRLPSTMPWLDGPLQGEAVGAALLEMTRSLMEPPVEELEEPPVEELEEEAAGGALDGELSPVQEENPDDLESLASDDSTRAVAGYSG